MAKETRESIIGTSVTSSGKIYEEYLSILRSPDSFSKYDKMSRSDYQVIRMLRVLFTPIKAADWKYSPEDINDEEQKTQAALKNKLLKEFMTTKWSETLNELLTYVKHGFAYFEPTAHVVNDPEFGKIIAIKNLGYIKQSTVYERDIQDGELKRIRQLVSTQGKSTDKWINTDGFLILVNMKEGENYEGISVLRGVYGNYVRKDLYAKIDMIGLEKMAVGTPVMYATKNIYDDPSSMEKLELVLEAYISHEKQYIILPADLKDDGFEIKEGKYDNAAIDMSIKREDTAIIDSILASFLNIGTSRAGGNAQNSGHQELFLNSLLEIVTYVIDTIDPLIHEYYVLNKGVPKKRLKLKAHGIAKDDAEKAMTIITGYIRNQVIRPDDRLESTVREQNNLPPVDEATVREFSTVRYSGNGSPDKRNDTGEEDEQDEDN